MAFNFDDEIEILLNANKIVSYSYLVNNFGLCPYEAFDKLGSYLDRKQKYKNNLVVTLVVGAVERTSGIKHIMVVDENEFDKTSEKFEILSRKVHSIKNAPIQDFNSMRLAAYFFNDIKTKSNINLLIDASDRRKSTAIEQPNQSSLISCGNSGKSIDSFTTKNAIKNDDAVKADYDKIKTTNSINQSITSFFHKKKVQTN